MQETVLSELLDPCGLRPRSCAPRGRHFGGTPSTEVDNGNDSIFFSPRGTIMTSDLDLGIPTPTIVCGALGIVIVVLHSMQKFEESTLKKGEDDFTPPLMPKYLATREAYARSLVSYIGSMVGVLCAMSYLAPSLFKLPELAALKQYEELAPLGFALLLVGVLPNVPWLQDIEWHLRRFWHERAYIPKAAGDIADRLRDSAFEFSKYNSNAVLTCQSMQGLEQTDFEAPRGSIEEEWARISCLSYALLNRPDSGATKFIDSEILNRYADNIALQRRALEADVARYRRAKTSNPLYENNDLLTKKLRDALRQINILLVCAVRLKASHINEVFQSFGFKYDSSTPAPANQDLMIVGLTVMTASLLAFTGAAAFFSEQLWQPSVVFLEWAAPQRVFNLPIVQLILVGAAFMTADLMRTHLLRKERWFPPTGPKRIFANYIVIVLYCLIPVTVLATISYYLYFYYYPDANVGLWLIAKIALTCSMAPAVTGGFYAYHLDNAELGRPSRLLEIGSQTLLTALPALVGVQVWLPLMYPGGMPAGTTDFVVFITLFDAVMGFSLAWYLPNAAATHRRDQTVQVKEARIEKLGNVAAIVSWKRRKRAAG
jgi:hypothetical protein